MQQLSNLNKGLTLQDLGLENAFQVKNLSDEQTLLILRKAFDISLNGKLLIATLEDKYFIEFCTIFGKSTL